jgi:predicted HAD superfamily Cof-like phosphohydrolase
MFKVEDRVFIKGLNKKGVVKEVDIKENKSKVTHFNQSDQRITAWFDNNQLRKYLKPKDNKYYHMVYEFHKAFDHPTSTKPTRLTKEKKKSHIDWMLEELNEYKNANTLVDEVDALIDLQYFLTGTFVLHGVKPDRIFEIVHNANMSKLWEDGKPRYREEDGKVIKPPSWQNPEPLIAKEIENQSR